MDRNQKLEYQKDVEKYLESKGVYDLFEGLLKNLIINKPTDPLQFLIDKLSEPEHKKIFLVGPPGSNVRELSLSLCDHFHYTCVSVGDLLKKEISKKSELGHQIENSIKNFMYVKDDVVIEVVKKHLDDLEKEKKNVILEGFPKTRVQGLALQRQGIIPNSFIILNLNEDKIKEGCLEKINNSDGYYSHIPESDKEVLANYYGLEYSLNIKHVKEIYKDYFFQVDASNSKEEILEDVARLLKYKIKQKSPKRSQKIIVLGPPGSGRTTLAKKLSEKYGFVYISTDQLLKDQINRHTEVGKMALGLIKQGELVPDEIIMGLIRARIQQTDCLMQGYIFDGFPKSQVQLQAFEDLKINPSFVIVLECPESVIHDRFDVRRIDPITGVIYNRITGEILVENDSIKGNNPQDYQFNQQINLRLQQIPNETREIVTKRIQRWRDILKQVEQLYSPIIFKINGSISAKNVLEKVSYHLENSI